MNLPTYRPYAEKALGEVVKIFADQCVAYFEKYGPNHRPANDWEETLSQHNKNVYHFCVLNFVNLYFQSQRDSVALRAFLQNKSEGVSIETVLSPTEQKEKKSMPENFASAATSAQSAHPRLVTALFELNSILEYDALSVRADLQISATDNGTNLHWHGIVKSLESWKGPKADMVYSLEEGASTVDLLLAALPEKPADHFLPATDDFVHAFILEHAPRLLEGMPRSVIGKTLRVGMYDVSGDSLRHEFFSVMDFGIIPPDHKISTQESRIVTTEKAVPLRLHAAIAGHGYKAHDFSQAYTQADRLDDRKILLSRLAEVYIRDIRVSDAYRAAREASTRVVQSNQNQPR